MNIFVENLIKGYMNYMKSFRKISPFDIAGISRGNVDYSPISPFMCIICYKIGF
jgi:hypothetical protein